MGTVRRSSVITPTPPSSPIPTLTDGDASGLGEVERDPSTHQLLDLSQESDVFFQLEHTSGFLHNSSRSLDSTLPQQDQDRLAWKQYKTLQLKNIQQGPDQAPKNQALHGTARLGRDPGHLQKTLTTSWG